MPKSKIDGGVKNVLREDKVVSENPERVEILIGLAPEKENRHIKVKAVFLNE
ncbi:MAG: hypothetical protein Q8N69_03150 [bacterium]|nr:hypothetical protein [bacterium]